MSFVALVLNIVELQAIWTPKNLSACRLLFNFVKWTITRRTSYLSINIACLTMHVCRRSEFLYISSYYHVYCANVNRDLIML